VFFVDAGIANVNADLSGGAQFNSLWFHGQGTGTGMDMMDGMDKNGLLNGQWTGMDTYSR